MNLTKLKSVVKGVAFVLSLSSLLFADAVFDGEFENDQNEFGYYWYYYDDNAGVGENDRPQVKTPGTSSVIDVEYKDSVRHAFGDDNDIYVIKSYKFTRGNEGDQSFATMPFTLGSTWQAKYGVAQPYVGIGSMLCKNGSKLDLTGATSVKFKIRSHVNDLTIRFKIQTKEIDDISEVKGDLLTGDEFGYYGAPVTISTSWEEKEIKISDLELPGTWAREIPFNIKSATKLAWEVSKDANPTAVKDTLDIDNITFVGYTFIDPTFWYKFENASDSKIPSNPEFATFDKAPYNETPMKMYWYAYNDADIEGNSKITAGAIEDPESKRLSLEIKEKTGSDGEGQGALIEYQIGAPVIQGANSVEGFVGIGVNTYDSARSKYWNFKATGYNSIYFHYVTDGDAKMVTLEVSDINDVGDAENPERKDSRGPGVVYYRNLPPTNGEWKAVEIPLDSLVYHDDWTGSKFIAFDQENLAKLQWKVQGKEGLSGKFAIDNVFFTKYTDAVIRPLISNHYSPFQIKYVNGRVHAVLDNNTCIANGKVSLCNAIGRLIMTNTIKNTSTFSINLSADKFTPGLYFIKLQGVNTNGKAVNLQSPIHIVK